MNKITLLLIAFMVAFLSPCYAFEIPGSTWKGAAEVTFKGKCVDNHSGNPIKNFSVKFGSENIEVQTEEGNYKFSIQTATFNGKKYWSNFKTITTLGPASENLTLFITAKGYNEKQITIPKNKILIGQDTIIDISLEKQNKDI